MVMVKPSLQDDGRSNFKEREFVGGEEKDKETSSNNNNSVEEDFGRYWPVYQAAMQGDWNAAKNFFPDIKQLSTTVISSNSETALHIAVMIGKRNQDFVKRLVDLAPPEALALKDSNDGHTPLQNAALVGNTEAAKAMVKKNPDLLYILSNICRLPVLVAAIRSQKETLEYLLSEHEKLANDRPLFEGQIGIWVLIGIIASEFVGRSLLNYSNIALDIVHKYPDLALLTHEGNGECALSILSNTPTLFTRMETLSWWQKFIYNRTSGKPEARK